MKTEIILTELWLSKLSQIGQLFTLQGMEFV